MHPRFYAPDLDPDEPEVRLTGDEARHLHRVLRLRPGDEVIVFDGRGTAFTARIASADREAARLTLVATVSEPAQGAVALTLVQSVLKGEAMDEVIRDCTMAGVDSIQPILSERTTVKTAVAMNGPERWRRIAIAAAKQSGRSRLPRIERPIGFDEWLGRGAPAPAFILVEPAATVPDTITVRALANEAIPDRATVVVGPEGGWTTTERDLAIAAGCRPLSLGRLTLRADAVPLAATAALLAIWNA